MCNVDSYEDFLTLVDFMNGNKKAISKIPKILCIVGPSGSRKQELADILCAVDNRFARIKTCTTAKVKKGSADRVSKEEFHEMLLRGEFIETTWYSGERYGTKKYDIDNALATGKNPVIVMDISGCLSIYNAYPGQCIMSIIQKPALRREQVADRIVSFEFEEKNKVLADHIVSITSDTFMREEIQNITTYLHIGL